MVVPRQYSIASDFRGLGDCRRPSLSLFAGLVEFSADTRGAAHTCQSQCSTRHADILLPNFWV